MPDVKNPGGFRYLLRHWNLWWSSNSSETAGGESSILDWAVPGEKKPSLRNSTFLRTSNKLWGDRGRSSKIFAAVEFDQLCDGWAEPGRRIVYTSLCIQDSWVATKSSSFPPDIWTRVKCLRLGFLTEKKPSLRNSTSLQMSVSITSQLQLALPTWVRLMISEPTLEWSSCEAKTVSIDRWQ
jgi:hypothetical protein